MIICLLIVMITYFLSSPFKNKRNKEVSTNYNRVIALTFDDGPSIYTKEIVKVLKSYNCKATFFEIGKSMKENQETVLYLIQNEMEVGSHTYSHKNLSLYNEDKIIEEFNSSSIIYNEITGMTINITRIPYGIVNDKIRRNISTPIIGWNLDTKDWLYQDEEYISNYIIENIDDGDIVLMHDIYYTSLLALKKVLPLLINEGYKITTISELSKIKGTYLEKGKVYNSF